MNKRILIPLSFCNVFWITSGDFRQVIYFVMKVHDGSHHVCYLCGGRVHLSKEDVKQHDTKAGKAARDVSMLTLSHSIVQHACCCCHVLALSLFLSSDCQCVHEGDV